jgi:hypothetical protein
MKFIYAILLTILLNGCIHHKNYYTPNGVISVASKQKGQIEMAGTAANVAAVEMRGAVKVAKDLHLSANFMSDVGGGGLESGTYNAIEAGVLKSFPIDSTQFHQVGLFVGAGNAGNFHAVDANNTYLSNARYLETPVKKVTAQYSYTLELKKSDAAALLFRARFLPRTASQVSVGTRLTNINIDKNNRANAQDYPSGKSYFFVEPFVVWKAGKGRFQFQHQVLYSLALNGNKPVSEISDNYGFEPTLEKHFFFPLQQNVGFSLKF